jgi:hypothetical protein
MSDSDRPSEFGAARSAACGRANICPMTLILLGLTADVLMREIDREPPTISNSPTKGSHRML